MKQIFLFAVLFLNSLGLFAQNEELELPPPLPPPPPIEEVEDNFIFSPASVQQKPMFPGGEVALFKYMNQEIIYPIEDKQKGISGKVLISFVVSKTGVIEDVQLVRGIGIECDQEALKFVKSMPAWSPGKNNGKPVKVRYTLPISFKL